MPTMAGFILMHVFALSAFFLFTWQGLASFLLMYFLTGCLGITLCYHRLLSHRSYKTSRVLKYVLAFFGCLAIQGGPISWSATHRLHHAETDKELDPHSPSAGFLWSHFLWTFYTHPALEDTQALRRYALDLDEDPGLRFMETYYKQINWTFPFVLFALGFLMGGWTVGLSMVLWGFVLRTVCFWHATWFVNSATHIWGYRNYGTTDKSRNLWWVALLTFGEGWHNNHHAHPRAARNGHRWFEVDITYWLIKAMQWVWLASHVVPVRKKEPPSSTS
jgi:stearoyl-CoA desaturase (delta-9 desaturase)